MDSKINVSIGPMPFIDCSFFGDSNEQANNVKIIKEDIKYFKKIFTVLEDLETTSDKLFTIAELYKVRGKQIHDANIVTTILENNIKDLFTHNVKDFERYNSKDN